MRFCDVKKYNACYTFGSMRSGPRIVNPSLGIRFSRNQIRVCNPCALMGSTPVWD